MTITYPLPAVRNAWADSAVPTTDIVDPGTAYAAAGWLQSTTPPPRQYFNWALNWTAGAVRYFMQNGVVGWQTGELYQSGAVVVLNNFVYQSLINANTGNNPLSSPAAWGPLTGYATLANLAAYVTSAQLAINLAAYAAKDSPTFVGVPLAPTPATNDSSGKLATTAFVQNAISTIGIGGYLTIVAAQGFGAGRLPAGIYRNSLGSGVVTIQQGGAPAGGQPGDVFFIY